MEENKLELAIKRLNLPFSWKIFIQKKEMEQMAFKPLLSKAFAKEEGVDYFSLRLYQFFKNAIGVGSFNLIFEEALLLGITIKCDQIEQKEEMEFYKQKLK